MTNSSSEPTQRLGEFAMIAKLFAPLAANAPGAFGLTDDAATLGLAPGEELVVTVDALVEGVHFFKDDPAAAIAKKALRVNLSDLAAKGARPCGYLLALSLPPWIGDEWLAQFAAGLGEDQEKFGIDLLGGDTTSTPGPLTLSITALGSVPSGRMLRRAGAMPGNRVFVSGTIGDAGAGLDLLQQANREVAAPDRAGLIARYRLPEPRLALGGHLIGLATAAADVSDGLIADLGHIAETSKVRIVIDAARIPLSPALARLWGREGEAVLRAATAGDDYEIVFTAPQTAAAGIAKAAQDTGIPVAEIGRVETGQGAALLDENGDCLPIPRSGFTHF
ncbi:MAG TPA: thiamine-phosphate kinase [Micropepsaceae bacterium]|jgi:thiamine-monophosphate kinase